MKAAMNSSDDDDEDSGSTTSVTRTDRFVFHEKHSQLVSVSSDRKTATRQMPVFCCDRGIVFSEQQLRDDEVFEIRIDQIMPVSMWEHSLDIGKCDGVLNWNGNLEHIGRGREYIGRVPMPTYTIINHRLQ